MNYNENLNNSSSGRRLTRRPMETPGLDVNNTPMAGPSTNDSYFYSQPSHYMPSSDSQSQSSQQQFYYNDFTSMPSQPQQGYSQNNFGYSVPSQINNIQQGQNYEIPSQRPQIPQQSPSMFIPSSNIVDAFGNNPLLAGATVRYGQKIIGQVVDENVGKYTSGISAEIKRYFAVDTRYVISKLVLLLFPFARTDWSIILESRGDTNSHQRAGPKTDINAPDLYIPTVSFVTYLLFLGLILGKHGQFSPELLSVYASRALAWEVFLVAIEVFVLYVTNVHSSLKTLDLTSYSGYKYFGIVLCVPVGLLFGETLFYITLIYSSVAFMYFLLFSMRCQLNSIVPDPNVNQTIVMVEYKRKRTLYFVIMAVMVQPITTWYLISSLTFAM
ncbi:protein YIF1A isoform X2 [Daktulosphaira vitifoliae]|uniref:protein YIF1A isoform X2 n=1 Tax=Daktulosphaira vitifoliae TaxID=58002 RepID=UPI0021AA5769|nr:protein YIF1A isoform X2 [Daktulosphaira vitifoliae]